MDPFVALSEVARRQHRDADLPEGLLAEILAIAAAPERHLEQVELVERLIREVEDFDSYAGVGCFGDSVSADSISATVRVITGSKN